MEVQTTAPTADTAAPVTSTPAQTFDPGSVSESEYAHARTSYEKEHGPGSWLNRDFTAPAATKTEQTTTDTGTTEVAEATDGDAEPGEITINADGKAIDTKTGRFVPKSAYLRVKGDLTSLRGEKDAIATELVKARERLSIFAEATQTGQTPQKVQAAEAPKPVDPKEDIFGAFNYALHQIGELQKQLENANKGVSETQQTIERNAVQTYARNDAEAFAAKTPDFRDALTHVTTAIQEFAMSAGVDAEGAKQAALQQLQGIINASRASGTSWAQVVYDRAKKIGYQPKGGETDAQRKAREDIERINAAGAAAHSMRGAGGGGVGEQLTAGKLAGMSEGEYFTTRKAYIAKNGVAAWERLVNT